jgi:hypothetical protein
MRRRFVFLFILSSYLSSCATTYAKKDKTWNPKDEVAALVVHYSVVDQVSLASKKSILGVVKDVAVAATGGKDRSPLAISGEKSLARLRPIFSHYNMQLYFDSEATKKASSISGVVKSKRANQDAGKGSIFADGNWLHPETVEQPFHMKSTLFQEKYYQSIAAKTLEGDKKKVAVSIGLDLNVKSSWIIGWKCEASFLARAIDSAGKPIFVVSSSGYSGTRWFGGKNRYLVDACPQAVERSLENLSKVKPGEM